MTTVERFRGFSDIRVELVAAIGRPYELSVATARTCYSGRGVIFPDEVSKDEKASALRDRIADSTREAGHLTTRQHAHFVFAISGISRQCLWSFLHSHPFYNSEQVSQRYVRVRPDGFLAPPLPESAQRVFHDAAVAQMQDYEALIGALREQLAADYFERFPARKRLPEKWSPSIDKRAYEVARYVLGVGTTAYLYHTVSALTLMRLARLTRFFDVPQEQGIVVGAMLDRVRELDPLFEKDLEDPFPLERTPEYLAVQEASERAGDGAFAREFDEGLGGRISRLVAHTHRAEETLAAAVRTTLARRTAEMSDTDAISLVLDPTKNPVLADTLNLSMQDRLCQSLHHVHFAFHKKLSHAADSQDQRHRMVPASRPVMRLHFTGEPDVVTPFGVTQSPMAREIFESSTRRSFAAVGRLLEMGVPEEHAFYLLPNAVAIRMVSSGDLLAHHHKWKLRTCYNAQEEIFRASVEEVRQVGELFPRLGEHLRAPCYLRLRAGTKPYCPEGERFCGLPVWKYGLEQYQRKSL